MQTLNQTQTTHIKSQMKHQVLIYTSHPSTSMSIRIINSINLITIQCKTIKSLLKRTYEIKHQKN